MPDLDSSEHRKIEFSFLTTTKINKIRLIKGINKAIVVLVNKCGIIKKDYYKHYPCYLLYCDMRRDLAKKTFFETLKLILGDSYNYLRVEHDCIGFFDKFDKYLSGKDGECFIIIESGFYQDIGMLRENISSYLGL